MRYNKPRRNRFRSNDKNFRRNGSQNVRTSGFNSGSKNFHRISFGGNGFKAEKLLEKYNNLAREALSSGDKILSESYFQHADHFLRLVENRNSIQNNSKPHLDNSSIEESSGDKIILEDKKNSSSQQSQNIEEMQSQNIEKI
jgi:hypothetical protein